MMFSRGIAIVIVAPALLGGAARADLMRLDYGGVVTGAPAGSVAQVGDRFAGTLLYESPAGGPLLSYPWFAQYHLDGAPAGAASSLAVGGRVVASSTGPVTVSASQGLVGDTADPSQGPSNLYFMQSTADGTPIQVGFTNADRPVLPAFGETLGLPSAIRPGDFTSATLTYGQPGSRTADGGFTGTIDAVTLGAVSAGDLPPPTTIDPGAGPTTGTAPGGGGDAAEDPPATAPTPIPEPASLAAFAGLVGWIGVRHRRKTALGTPGRLG